MTLVYTVEVTANTSGFVRVEFLVDGIVAETGALAIGTGEITVNFAGSYPTGDRYSLRIGSVVNDGTIDEFSFIEINTEQFQVARTLTVVDQPCIWKDFARTISIVEDGGYDLRNGTDGLRFTTFQVDANKQTLQQDNFVESVAGVDVTTNNIKKTSIPYIDNARFMQVQYSIWDGVTECTATQPLFYEILESGDCENLIYMGWVNSKGAIDQHMFYYNQIIQREVEIGLLSEAAINQDIEGVFRTKKRLPDKWTQSMIVTSDHLTRNQLVGLSEMKQGDFLLVYLKKDISKVIFVVAVNDLDVVYETNAQGGYTFSMQIEFPDNFDIKLAKQY